jgi:hypothetical protein
MICIPHQKHEYLEEANEGEMGRASNMQGREHKCMQHSDSKT